MTGQIETAFARAYEEILSLARARLARERAPISTITLAHELFINLHARPDLQFPDEAHFFAYLNRAMRSILIDKARERLAQKRSAELLPLTLGAHIADSDGTPEQLIALDDALEQLGRLDERLLRVAEMRIDRAKAVVTRQVQKLRI